MSNAMKQAGSPATAGSESCMLSEAAELLVGKTRRDWTAVNDVYLPLDSVIGVGVGYAALTRDGEPVYEQKAEEELDELMRVAQAERLASAAEHHEWCIHLIALLEDRHYRRVAPGWWKLYRRGHGLS